MIAINGKWSLEWALHSQLNDRGKTPEAYPGFRVVAEYPAKGTMRYNVSGGNDWGWFDEKFA